MRSVLPNTIFADGPRLLADVGGTNARFTLETAPRSFAAVKVLPCADYPDIGAAITAYLQSPEAQAVGAQQVRHAALAIANPVSGDMVRMTNHDWEFSIQAVRAALKLQTLDVVNDFTALAMAVPQLGEQQRFQVGGVSALAGSVIGVIGPGTGLGVSGLVPSGARWIPLSSEGGHVSFSPVDETEVAILRFCWQRYGHVSAERLISGPGLELIYRALAAQAGQPAQEFSAADISRRAAEGGCPLCSAALDRMCGMLGTVAANLAVTLGAKGGIYIGGGIVPRMGERFAASSFRARFEAKGRYAGYLAAIPVYVITEAYPAFLGVSSILDERLGAA